MTSRARLQRAGVFASLGLVLLASAAPGSAQELEKRSRELKALRERIEAVQSALEAERASEDDATAELRGLERRIGNAQSELDKVRERLAASEERIAALRRERDATAARLAEQRGRLAKQVRSAYAAGREEYLRLLLAQDDPARVERMMVYYDYFAAARAARIRSASKALAELEAVERRLAEERRELERLESEQSQRVATLEEDRKKRAALLVRMRQDVAERGDQLKRLRGDAARLEELLARLRQQLADIPGDAQRQSFQQAKGQLDWPLQGPVLAGFGSKRLGRMHWSGMLIGAESGEPVRAVAHGRVVFSEWLRGLGLLIIIDHGDGYMTLYGHNQSLYKEVGDWVDAGEVVATVGATGGRERSALYFEIRASGRPVDPQAWLSARR